MLRAMVADGLEVEYEVRGSGEPVMLIHAGVLADWFAALPDEPPLAGYSLIRYHRIGYAGSDSVEGPVTIEQLAGHGRTLMRQLGVERAHVVGHSSSANMALQLALDDPDAVRSVVAMEPALLAVPSGPFAAPAMQAYRAGDRTGALDIWMRGVCGPDYRKTVDRVLPGACERAEDDADMFFGQELPAVRAWTFGPDEAGRIRQPVLAVLGEYSGEVSDTFPRRHELMLAWLPDVESFVLPGANHALHLQNPTGLAEALADFFGRHPIRGA